MTGLPPSSSGIMEVLEHYADQYCEGWCKDCHPDANFHDCGGCKARLALRSPAVAATPPGVVSVELLNSERRVNDDLRAENDRLRALAQIAPEPPVYEAMEAALEMGKPAAERMMAALAQDAPEPVLTGLQEDLILMSFHNEPVPQVAQGSFDTQYRDGLEEIGRYAKKLRKSRDLIGPAEYANDAKAMKVWQRALYHEGKTIEGLVKAALRGAQLHEPEKTVTSSVPSTVAQGPLQQEELAAIIRTGMSFGKPAFAIAGNILAALALSSTQRASHTVTSVCAGAQGDGTSQVSSTDIRSGK